MEGTKKQFALVGSVMIDYIIEDIPGESMYLVSMNISYCYEDGHPCYMVTTVFDNTRLPKDLCEWKTDYHIPNFSFETWKGDHGLTIGDPLPMWAELLLYEQTGLSPYLQYSPSQCSRNSAKFNSSIAGGWINECSLTTTIQDLSSSYTDITCHVTSSCTEIECCVGSVKLHRPFHVVVKLDPCDFVIKVGIENFHFKLAMVDYIFGEQRNFSLGGIVKTQFTVYDIESEYAYLLDMNVSVCTESAKACEQDYLIAQNVLLPKKQCTWDAGFVHQNLSLTQFKADNQISGNLESYDASRFLDEAFVSFSLLATPCDRKGDLYSSSTNGWITACSDVPTSSLLALANTVSCNVDNTCEKFTCCFEETEVGRSIEASVQIDSCKGELIVTLERMTRTISLTGYVWGTEEVYKLNGVYGLRFTVNNLITSNKYLVNMDLMACYEASGACALQETILLNFELVKAVCDRSAGFIDSQFSYSSWLSSVGLPVNTSPLPEWARLQLIEDLDVNNYFSLEKKCYNVMKPFMTANATHGFNNECNGVRCCVDVPQLATSLEYKLIVDTCGNRLRLKVDKLETDISLHAYVFGSSGKFSLYGLAEINYLVSNLFTQYEVTMSIQFCLNGDSLLACDQEYTIFNKTVFNKESCDYNTGFKDSGFSLSAWLADRSLGLTNMSIVDADDLLQLLQIDDFMEYSNICNFTGAPYVGAVDGWNNECNNTASGDLTLLPETELLCHIATDCNTVSCCAKSEVLKRDFYVAVTMNTCRYTLIIQLENLIIDKVLLNYAWGTTENMNLYGVLRVVYSVNHVASMKHFNVDLTIKLCYDSASGSCLQEYTIFTSNKLYYPECTEPKILFYGITFDYWKPKPCSQFSIETYNRACPGVNFTTYALTRCQMAADCFSVKCCLDLNFLPGKRNTELTFALDTCADQIDYTLERHTWTRTGLASINGIKQVESLSSSFMLNFTLDTTTSATAYKTTIGLTACYISPGTCEDYHLLTASDLKIKTCPGRRRRRSAISEVDIKDMKTGLRTLTDRNATDAEKNIYIAACIEYSKNSKDYSITYVGDDDEKTGGKSVLKALGSGNPTTVGVSGETFSGTFTVQGVGPLQFREVNIKALGSGNSTTVGVSGETFSGTFTVQKVGPLQFREVNIKALGSGNSTTVGVSGETFSGTFTVQGAEEIFKELKVAVTGIKDAYAIGQGLSEVGAKLLGEKLANMTVGDIETLMDFKNVDPILVAQLMKDLRDLAKALLSEFLTKLLNNGDDVFKSFDFTLKGDFSFPQQDVELFSYSINMLVGGIIPMQFSFGAGAYYGMKFEIAAKVLEMKAICGVEPYGGVMVYGELGIGFLLYGKLRLEGKIMDLRFPTTAEISFNKFPLDVGLVMYLKLTPIELNLYALVTLEVRLGSISFKKILFKAKLWSYKTPTITKKLIDNRKDEEDKTPPDISPFSDEPNIRRKKRATASCDVEQIAGRDYVEPMFEIAVRAEDDRSDVTYFLDVGTVQGGKDVMDQHTLGGPKTSIDERLSTTGVPLYFTMYAQNDAGARSMATCSLNTYDVTLPGGRFTEDFLSTSNPAVMRASVVVYEDSDIVLTQVGLGYGKDVWGDQVIPWNTVNVNADAFVPPDLSNDPHNHKVMEMFTAFRVGRLIAPFGGVVTKEATPGDCAKRCADLPKTKCMSFNYDFMEATCELLEGIQGHHYKLAVSRLFQHYERLGIGHILSFDYNTLWLTHNKSLYFNFRIINNLGFESIISTPGIMVDTTPPETSPINNSTIDYLELVDCRTKIIPTDRPDFLMWCRGEHSVVKNHRVIQDGPESLSVFNGPIFMKDMKYTRANNYISANWDGFNDKETGILFITIAVGTEICEEKIHEHHDPHSHLYDSSQWTHSAMISPLPAPYEQLPDDQYFITVRAINGVKYGGPLATTVCHTTPYIVDNSPPIIYELYNIQYDEFQYNLTYRHNSSDPQSGILYNDCCLGLTQRDCYELPWTRQDYSHFVMLTVSITAGIPIWVKIKAINNVDLRTIRAADRPIIVDPTPPIAGNVYDGQTYGVDLAFAKFPDKICANWQGFFDPESGISFFMVSVGSEPLENVTDISNLTQIDRKHHKTCVFLEQGSYLEHGNTYYTTVWAYNGGARQLNSSSISNGVLVDLSAPVSGKVVDGLQDNFGDLDFTSSQAKVEAQWKDYYDPESSIKQYDVQVSSAQNMSNDFLVIREWVMFSKDSNSARWLNFHLAHRDRIKIELKTTNGALNSIVNETDTYVVDLTPPALSYLGDGLAQGDDIDFQSDATSLSTNFKFEDHESGIDYYRIQIYEKSLGTKIQLVPKIKGEWLNLFENQSRTSYTRTGMSLKLGAIYSVRVGSLNKAGNMAVYETDSVRVDTSSPSVKWLKVGTLVSGEEEKVHGYVWQANTKGIKAAWLAVDPESGVIGYEVAVGTTPGGTDKLGWTLYGAENDVYIQSLSLNITNLTTKEPVYYVNLKAQNGAQLLSSVITSTPIVVVEEDKKGLVVDGADRTDENTSELGVDVDYTVDTTTVTIQFNGFESHLHGVMMYEWAVGTSPGGEDVQPFMSEGIIHLEEENVAGDGVTSSGHAHATLPLKPETMYYASVRGITNVGNVLQSSSDGFIGDISPPLITIDRLTNKIPAYQDITSGNSLYQTTTDSLTAQWTYNDTESGIVRGWYSVGTYPFAEDIASMVEVEISSMDFSSLPLAYVTAIDTGKPNIISIWAENKAGLVSEVATGSVIIDKSPPGEGFVSCPDYVGLHAPILCTWHGFLDKQSPIQKYIITMGSQQGSNNIFNGTEVPGYMSQYSIQGLGDQLQHGDKYYVTVTAVNYVDMEAYAFSSEIGIDSTPPTYGKVIDLHTTYRVDVTDTEMTLAMNAKKCDTDEECDLLDATCSESMTSVSATWQLFQDPESGVQRYQIALGTTPGGGQIKPFFDINLEDGVRYYTISSLNLVGYRVVYVSVRGINGASLTSVVTSNGLYMSYLSQGMDPLSHVGVADILENSVGDVQFQSVDDTYRASWDMSGDPCPVTSYEWKIQRLDGLVIQDWLKMNLKTDGMTDGLRLENGKMYYSLVKVTNALNYTYILRSDGVTIEKNPLLPGKVFDGDIRGYDIKFLPSNTIIYANWDGFGLPSNAMKQVNVLSGNPGLQVDQSQLEAQDPNQEVVFYEVAVGTDRRFPKTRDDVVPFTNVGLNKTVIFYDLELTPLTGNYYFTVKAYSASYSIATVTSNGFKVGFNEGVTAGVILMQKYIATDTYLDIQFEGFTSKLDILMYHVALSNNSDANNTNCKAYIDGGSASVEEKKQLFTDYDATNINKYTFTTMKNLDLIQGASYYVYVMGTDKSGACGMVMHEFIVDFTQPDKGRIKTGPYFDMPVTYNPSNTSVYVYWEGYFDNVSDIATYEVSLWRNKSCSEVSESEMIVSWITLTNNYTDYSFIDLTLNKSEPLSVKFIITNGAGLSITDESVPILVDMTKPTPGKVVDGWDFKKDRVWFNSPNSAKGSILHMASPFGMACPTRPVPILNDTNWKILQQIGFRDPTGQNWPIKMRTENIGHEIFDDELWIKLARDTNLNTMYSGGYFRKADYERGGEWEFEIKAASGEGMAATSVMLWDGPEGEIMPYNHVPEADWSVTVCYCCFENPIPTTCTACNCTSYLTAKFGNGSIVAPTTEAVPVVKYSTSSPYKVLNNPKGGAVIVPIGLLMQPARASCGIEIFAGDDPHVVTWCRIFNDTLPPQVVEDVLTFDPSADFHTYRIVVDFEADEAVNPSLCFYLYVDGVLWSKVCGIRDLSTDTDLIFHVFPKNNYLPPVVDTFDPYSTKAFFRRVVLPPELGALCRYGAPFRGGENPIIKYEIGIGTTKLGTEVVPYRDISVPCLPCPNFCSRYNCNSTCDADKYVLYPFMLDNFTLPATRVEDNETKTIDYYITVKAVLSSGITTVVSSDGFYIDDTPPIFDPDVMGSDIYIDVDQGEFTPVRYQGCNSTIKAFWRCYDDESDVVENLWAIGTTVGGQDLQEFESVGTNQVAMNSTFEGILEQNTTYYVSLICANGAGHVVSFNDTKGVIVLLEPPIDDVNTTIPGATQLSVDVVPKDALQSTDSTKLGVTFTLSHDDSVNRYDLCCGTDEGKEDIFPCTWVGYNVSGTVMIDDGYVKINGVNIRPLSELNRVQNTSLSGADRLSSANNVFKMEPGRTVFLMMRLCNAAMRCFNKTMGSVIITNANTDLETSLNGLAITISVSSSSGRRKKRAVRDDLVIVTPSNLTSGHSTTFTILTYTEITATYDSAASTDFVPYIIDPSTTTDLVDRILLRRLYESEFAFSFVSVGHIMMPGPILMTFSDVAGPELHSGNRTILTNWNPVRQLWEESSRTCNETDTEVFNNDGTVTIKVCNTWRDLTEGAVNDPYFKHETMFSLANAKASITNSEPYLTVPDVIYMSEDAGTIQYQLEATDDEGDTIEFYLVCNYSNYTMGTPILSVDGILLFTPCENCQGIQTFPVILQEVQNDLEIPPNNVTVWLTVNVTDIANPPVIFLTLIGESQLPADPTEPVIVYLEQKNDWNEPIWSPSWNALLGAYDIESEDKPQLNVQEPDFGTLNIIDNTTDIPTILNPCPNVTRRTDNMMFPCDLSLLKPVHEHEWNYMKLTYIQNYSFSGYDVAKIYFSDANGGLSHLVTIQFTVLESPCRNGGECEPKDISSYPCKHYRRAVESFDINYNCICASGWTGIHCEENINECMSFPCHNPFVCYDYVNHYECECPEDNQYCWVQPWMIVLSICMLLISVIVVSCIVYRLKKKRGRYSIQSTGSLEDSSDESDGILVRNDIFDPDQILDNMDCTIEKIPMLSSFEPLNTTSDPKIGPHPSEANDIKVVSDSDSTPKPADQPSRLPSPSGSKSSNYIVDRQLSTPNPATVSMNDGTVLETSALFRKYSFGSTDSHEDSMDESDRLLLTDILGPDQISDNIEFSPKDDSKIEECHLMSSFEPLITSSGSKIAPRSSKMSDLSEEIKGMSKHGWKSSRIDTPPKQESSGYAASMSQALSSDDARWAPADQLSGLPAPSGSKSPDDVFDRQMSTADPDTVSMNDETDLEESAL
ncbi:uncharacterized protein LOC143056125 [Mytilus galloprovincialis]|uniref:uncharacterized protein LOC143056125 n=1 Tax=Mytilus galloprovincialis TaxID=29158 RepID=UPI003F7C4652